jgi:ubiquinone/menaquinone biosynthesis C-methylase UbiE
MKFNERKKLVQDTYDNNAQLYRDTSQGQQAGLKLLLRLAEPWLQLVKPQSIIDIGCGPGTAIIALKELGLLDDAAYLGVDLSPRAIELAQQAHADERIRFETGDAETLSASDNSIDLAISYATLHWLNQPKFGMTPSKALAEIHRILKPGGLCLIATSSKGMEEKFRSIYHKVMSTYEQRAQFDRAQYVDDPLGCIQLHELVDMTSEAGLNVKLAQAHYRPLHLSSVHDHLEHVRSYGYDAYMAPIEASFRNEVFQDICKAYAEMAGPSAYVYEIYTNFLVAKKPGD